MNVMTILDLNKNLNNKEKSLAKDHSEKSLNITIKHTNQFSINLKIQL